MGQWERRDGQSLSEYVLAGLLIAAVALGALGLIGSTLASSLPDLLDKIFSDGSGAVADGGGSSGATDSPVPPPSLAGGSSPGQVSITFANGQTISLDDYPVDLAEAMETAGANGTTTRLLSSLEAMIRQMEEAGEIDSKEANRLRTLANQGHKIARLERLIEDAYNNSASLDEFLDTRVTFEGQTYNMHDLSNLVGWSGGREFDGVDVLSGTQVVDSRGSLAKAAPELAEFIELYQQAQTNGSTGNAQLDQVVHALGEQVALISGGVQDFVDTADNYRKWKNGEITGISASWEQSFNEMEGMLAQDFDSAFTDYQTSRLTDANSAGICNAGGGEDSGVHCP